MSLLSVRLLGKFRLYRDDRDLSELVPSKIQEMLCYLLIYRDRPHTRECLAAHFWGDTPQMRCNGYLRKALWQVHAAFMPYSGDQPLLLVDTEWVQTNPNVDLWLDVAELERGFSLVKDMPGQGLSPEQARLLEQVVALYGGDLLETCYSEWCLYERERLQHMYLSLVDKLMVHCEVSGEYESGIAYGNQILHYDRTRERTHRQMMRLYFLAGDRTSALRQYQRCTDILRKELGVEPSQRTDALYQQMLTAEGLPAHMAQLPMSEPAEPQALQLAEVAVQLRHLREMVELTQVQIDNAIQIVDVLSRSPQDRRVHPKAPK